MLAGVVLVGGALYFITGLGTAIVAAFAGLASVALLVKRGRKRRPTSSRGPASRSRRGRYLRVLRSKSADWYVVALSVAATVALLILSLVAQTATPLIGVFLLVGFLGARSIGLWLAAVWQKRQASDGK
jgi:hypothetical protein